MITWTKTEYQERTSWKEVLPAQGLTQTSREKVWLSPLDGEEVQHG